MRALNSRGFTLLELMIAVAIGALLLTVAAPALGGYLSNARVRHAGDVLVTEALLAQTESLKRNSAVQLEISGRSLVIRDLSAKPSAAPLHERQLPDGVTLSGATTLKFGSEGHPLPWGTEYTVRIRGARGECGADQACSVLQVNGGGSIGLCAEGKACP